MKPRSDTLFHFTRNVETLKSILKYGFWPRYSLEDFNWYSSSIGLISYPMVCFCDIPLARISDHIGFYGDFGIGVSRTWADTNRLNPLVYLANDTPVSLALSRLLNNNLTADNGYYQNSANDINSIISFVKPVWGCQCKWLTCEKGVLSGERMALCSTEQQSNKTVDLQGGAS